MTDNNQQLLFDVEEFGAISCENCDYGEWHLHDMQYWEKGLSVLYPCKRCSKVEKGMRVSDICINYSKWVAKRKKIIVEPDEEIFIQDEEIKSIVGKSQKVIEEDLFSVSETAEINKKIVDKKHEEENLKARALLNLKYYENPKNENEMLFNFQYEYLKNNSEESYSKLQEMSKLVTERLVWKWMSAHRTRLSSEEQNEKVSIAVEYVLRRYKTRIGYCVTKNFITTLDKGVEHAMLYKTKLDENTSFIDDLEGLIL